MKYINIYFES